MTKTVVITGASGTLGCAIAQHLATLGWNLVLTSRDASSCQPLAKKLRTAGVRVETLSLDLLDRESTETLSDRIAEKGVCVTHVVSNARSLDALTVGQDGLAQPEPFISELTIDVVGPYRLLMSFARDERHNLSGVVTVGSQYGEVAPNPALYDGDLSRSPVQYGVAKAALHHLTRELAVRLAPTVRVNCVAYGGFVGRTDDAFQERYARLAPLGRMLRTTDAGGPVAFLLDDAAASAVTGHVLVADGGWSVW
ncbi:SDR family NAD(P)-dependent oxidoreductase [Pseudogemmobacter faecipullorum]|uniref:SDR family oxidoreductase n=1 Tax=Pseudogemmobacter faecipullorum TaxID=2755041 RepID=A0ABS8CS42_9RHOB|nr:SDR family oxidoreductase [Pseudogemmobacter faecipullorum]MCB5411975.1 SDR family oxidoreductase [Pseudogemmobacter faecipullorum]